MSIISNPFDHTLKLLHHPDHLNKVIHGYRPFPIHLEVDLTNVCNHACSFCNMADTLASDNTILNFDILIERLKEAFKMGAKSISFTGGGEPTIHPKFDQIGNLCRDIGFDLGLITNGSLIKGKKLISIAENFNWVRISLGGPDPESYKNIQGREDFHKVLENCYELKEHHLLLKRKLNLGLKIMLTQANIEKVDKLTNCLKSHNLTSKHIDYIQFVPDQFTSDRGEFVSSNFVKQKLTSLKKELLELSIPLHGSFYSVKEEDRNLNLSSKCYAHFYQLAITATGDITFCKNSRENSNLIVGNIIKNTFQEIWDSEKILSLEKWINASNCKSFCKSLKLNNLIHSIKNPSPDYSENFF